MKLSIAFVLIASLSSAALAFDVPTTAAVETNDSHGAKTHHGHETVKMTLSNLKTDSLTTADKDFFDNMWMSAYACFNKNDDLTVDKGTLQETVHLRCLVQKNLLHVFLFSILIVIIEEEHPLELKQNRHMRALNNYYYDLRLRLEYTCGSLCLDYRMLKNEDQGEDDGRHLGKVGVSFEEEKFEQVLCNLLRAGPYEVFSEVTDCDVTFFLA
jgi:hypothetical protein